MKKFNYLGLLAVAAIALGSCSGLNKMKDKASEVSYQVTPEVLEAHGDKVAVKIDAKYPAKYFNKNAVLTATPVIKYDGGETALTPKVLQGESVKANNQVVNFSTGGSVSHSATADYNNNMMKSKLVIRTTAELKGKSLQFDDYPIADGVIATPELVMVDPKPVLIGDRYKRIIPDSYTASILYIINRSDITRSELTKEEIKMLSDYIAQANANERIELKDAQISAYASPDGPLELNEKLSKNREGSAENFFNRELKAKKVETPEGFLSTQSTPEDWEGFRKLMEESDIQDKEIILRVLSMYSDPAVREKEIKNISQAYDEVAKKILPQLRRARLTVNTELIGLSDDELMSAWKNNPDSLKLEEILYTATLYDDLNEKLAIYKKAGDLYPKCARAWNNQGYIYIQQNDVKNAQKAFEAAKALNDNDMINNNLGVAALMSGDVAKAEQIFTSATGAGAVVNYNLGIIKIMQGEYDAASKYLGNTDEFNTALVKLLKKDFDGALATINRVEGDFAKKHYLKAVIAAKQNKDDLVYESLRLAVAKDSSLKAYAQKDMEFAKYFENATFTGIVK
jgi:tetratricopeptide (TPR) repeat protein